MTDQPGSRHPSGKGGWYVPTNAASAPPKAETPNVPLPDNETPKQPGHWFVPAGAVRPTPPTPQAVAVAEPVAAVAVPVVETPAEPEPAQSAAPEAQAAPPGAALSTEVDYNNYVPGRGVVAADAPLQETDTAASPAVDLQPTGIQPSFNDTSSLSQTGPRPMTPAPAAKPLFPSSSALKSSSLPASAQAAASSDAPGSLAQRFSEVEQAVQVLRRKYTAGTLSGDQLRAELRKLMILDDTGSWWMIGMETDRWYKYNGQDWLQADPPGRGSLTADPAPGAASPIPGSEAAPIADQQPVVSNVNIPVDEFGMPLPQRVPIQDMGATMVGKSAAYLDNTLRTPGERQPSITSPAPSSYDDGGLTQPGAAVRAADLGNTVPSSAAYVAADAAPADALGGVTVPSPVGATYQPGDQPDYGAKPAGLTADRNRLGGCIVRGAIIAVFLTLAVSLVGIVGAVLWYYSIVNQYDSAIAALPQAATSGFQTTKIFDAANNVIAELNDPNNGKRQLVHLADISPYLIDATIATEDKRFYENPGFDIVGIARAVLQNARAGDTVSGASSITQQLARLLVFDPNTVAQSRSGRKLIEIVVASEISRRYTKNQILEMYLNQIPYGNFSNGIESAANTYFNKHAKDLNLAESAFLAGLPQAPATYDPVQNREAAFGRMNDVLRLMVEAGCLQMQHLPANQTPFCVTQADVDTSVVLIAQVKTRTYKQPNLNTYTHPHFVNYILQELEQQYGTGAIYQLGFNVYTTLDPTIQDASEKAVSSQIAALASRHVTNGASLTIRPSDGAILAMVGSADFNNKDISGQVNIVLAPRQPGSSIKPFVYAGTFERGPDGNYWTPATIIWDVATSFGGAQFRNYDGRFHGPQSVRSSLANSYNIPAVKALDYLTIDRFKQVADRVGLKFPLTQPDAAGLQLALGGIEVRLYDMVKGYAVFANQGKRLDNLYAIKKITKPTDNGEKVVFDSSTNVPALPQVMEPGIAYLITSILSDNNARLPAFGPGNPLQLSDGRPAAVKTGTTNDSRDNWTIGYTPDLVVGVWVGNADNTPMIGTSGVTGAAPIWNQIMTAATRGKPVQQFPVPPGVGQATICADFGTADFAECKTRRAEVFFAQNPPTDPQAIIKVVAVDQFSGLIANDFCPDYKTTKTFLANVDQSAIQWLNTTGDGQAWAAAHGLTLPITPPPTQQCDQNTPRPVVKIVAPQSGQQLSGLVQIMGSVSVPNFSRYQLELAQAARPDVTAPLGDPIRSQPAADNSFLGGWDTNNVPDGQYNLRLRAYDSQDHSVLLVVPVVVNNSNPQAAPQPIAATATPFGFPTLPPPGQPTSTSAAPQAVASPTKRSLFPSAPTRKP